MVTLSRRRSTVRFCSAGATLLLAMLQLGCALLVGGDKARYREWQRETNHASTAFSIGDLETANASFSRALEIARTFKGHGGPDEPNETAHLFLGSTLDSLSSVAETSGNYEECERRARESLALRENGAKKHRPLVATSLMYLASCVARLGRFEEAEELHDQLVAVHKPRAEPHDEFLAACHRRMGKAMFDLGRAEAALRHYEAALAVRLWSENSGRYDIAITQFRYANALRSLGRTTEAQEADEAAAAILKDSDYHREVTNRFYRFDWHWAEMPLRVHLKPLNRKHHPRYKRLRKATHDAIMAWNDVAGPGFPAFEIVEGMTRADIVIQWVENKGKYAWAGVTNSRFRTTDGQLLKARIKVATKRLGTAIPIEELYRVVLHEMGHAVGLVGHSPYPGDVMFFSLVEDGPSELSERDRTTLQMIY